LIAGGKKCRVPHVPSENTALLSMLGSFHEQMMRPAMFIFSIHAKCAHPGDIKTKKGKLGVNFAQMVDTQSHQV
jgi:hypothetical protein